MTDPESYQMRDLKSRLAKLEAWAIRENDRSRVARAKISKMEAKLALFWVPEDIPASADMQPFRGPGNNPKESHGENNGHASREKLH